LAEPDRAPEPPRRDLEPGQGIDRDRVGMGARADLADDHACSAALQQMPHARAECRDIGAGERPADADDDRARFGTRQWDPHFVGRQQRPTDPEKLIAVSTTA
jgi:hypothetical protein